MYKDLLAQCLAHGTWMTSHKANLYPGFSLFILQAQPFPPQPDQSAFLGPKHSLHAHPLH